MRTAMAAVCKFCTVVAVAVCAIILASQEVNAQQWVTHAVRIAASKILVNDSTRVVNVNKMKRLDLTEITRLNFSWVIWRKDVLTGRLFALSALRMGWALLQCTIVKRLYATAWLCRIWTRLPSGLAWNNEKWQPCSGRLAERESTVEPLPTQGQRDYRYVSVI